MTTNKDRATLFSGGQFAEVADNLAEDIEWNIYENELQIKGKQPVLDFGKQVAEYFQSVTTKFDLFGILEEDNKVSIYGRAEFIKACETINTVHSCDVYEFDESSAIRKIYSYCNSIKPSK